MGMIPSNQGRTQVGAALIIIEYFDEIRRL